MYEEITIGVSELTRKFGYYMKMVEVEKKIIILTRYGKKTAVLIPIELHEKLKNL